jgi:hypothetical protein
VTTIDNHVEIFIREWIETQEDWKRPRSARRLEAPWDINTLWTPGEGGGNFVNREGYKHLAAAANLLLKEGGLQQKITQRRAINCLAHAFRNQRDRVREGRNLSVGGMLVEARKQLESTRPLNGYYVFPVRFAYAVKNAALSLGPIRLTPLQKFKSEQAEALETAKSLEKTDGPLNMIVQWEDYAAKYDHVITVQMNGFESDMAWRTGREAAEFLLNLVRITFGYAHTNSIKLGGSHMGEQFRSSLVIGADGTAIPSWKSGPWGAPFEESWVGDFLTQLGSVLPHLIGFAHWLTGGDAASSPILRQLRYANQLLSEAYCEPHDHIQLVRLVAALEAFALLDRSDKARDLGVRCANVGGWGDTARALAIIDAVQEAYRWRSAIVHGESLEPGEIRTAFAGLEHYLLGIVVGYFRLFSGISRSFKPQSIAQTRREMKRSSALFFWDPDLPFSR